MTGKQRKHRIVLAVLLLCVSLAVALWMGKDTTGSLSHDDLLRRARLVSVQGKTAEAEQLARQAVECEPDSAAAYWLAAKFTAAQQKYEQALDDLAHIRSEHETEWHQARRLAASILHYQVPRFRDAERAYLDVLDVDPDDTTALEGYARLLGLCGRRPEAIPYVLRLVQVDYETDLLMLLFRESGALNDPELLQAAHQADPTDPNPIIGQARAAELALDSSLALQKLRDASKLQGLPDYFHGLIGKQLLACEAFDELDEWLQHVSNASISTDEWMVRAALAERSNDVKGAIRCYWEAVRVRPESLPALNQLAGRLTQDNRPELAKRFKQRVAEINELRTRQQVAILSGRQPTLDSLVEMIDAFEKVGRFWEAFAWGQAVLVTAPPESSLARRMMSLRTRLNNLPLITTAPDHNPALVTDLSHYSLPVSEHSSTRRSKAKPVSKNIAFVKHDQNIGFDFEYFNGAAVATYRMQELSGGGIAAFDFDNDTAPDLFCTQGTHWERPKDVPASKHHDCLFRNIRGASFSEVSATAFAVEESGFGQGVAAGDVNNDGFQDLYVANTHENVLWLNNGDGTFTQYTPGFREGAKWTTSCLIADINGDSVPDLYDVNYLSGEDVFTRTCREKDGGEIMCAPHDFSPATDRIWLGNGLGEFNDATHQYMKPEPSGKGLGILAMRGDGPQLSLFIANDTTANFLYSAEPGNASQLNETAISAGVAFSGDGKAEACMGIAAGDCNLDGRLDFLVTNFFNESNTLYSPVSDQLYQDATRTFRLHEPSMPVLGFGTQFLDANLNGRLELFVANGYTQDLSEYGVPYQMPPQLFEWTGQQFQQLSPEQIGEWSEAKVVGRSVTRFDWNLDGKQDLAVGLLQTPAHILTNTSKVGENQFVSLQLIAADSARDAISTIIRAKIGVTVYTHQLTAGDGFHCSNERRIHIGCGAASKIDQLTVEWPSGAVQEFAEVKTSAHYTLVEGHRLIDGGRP